MSKREREKDDSDTTGNGNKSAKTAKIVKVVKAKTITQLKLLLRELFEALFVPFDANGRDTRGMPSHHCIYVEDVTKNRPTVFSKILELCDTTKASQLSRCFKLSGELESKHLATSAKKSLNFNVTRSNRTVGNNCRDNTLTRVRFRARRNSGSHSSADWLGAVFYKSFNKVCVSRYWSCYERCKCSVLFSRTYVFNDNRCSSNNYW